MRKSLRFISCVFVLALCAGPVMAASGNAGQSGFFARLFGKRDVAPDPAVSLQAPFINPVDNQTPTANSMKLAYDPGGLSESSDNLSVAHRHEDQIGEWVMEKMAAALNIPANGYKIHLQDLTGFFDQYAVAGFDKFMRDTNILPRLETGTYSLRSFVDEKPYLINEGAVEKRYRWLFEVPVTLTFMPTGGVDNPYAEKGKDPATYKLIITTQVGRVSGGDDGLILENWSARSTTGKR